MMYISGTTLFIVIILQLLLRYSSHQITNFSRYYLPNLFILFTGRLKQKRNVEDVIVRFF